MVKSLDKQQLIEQACQLSKASIYYYIPSKSALLLMVLNYLQQRCEQDIFSVVRDPSISDSQKLVQFMQRLHTFYTSAQGQCLMISLAVEAESIDYGVSVCIENYFTSLLSVLEFLLQPYYAAQASMQAKCWISQLNGSLLLNRVFADNTFLAATIEELLANTVYSKSVQQIIQ